MSDDDSDRVPRRRQRRFVVAAVVVLGVLGLAFAQDRLVRGERVVATRTTCGGLNVTADGTGWMGSSPALRSGSEPILLEGRFKRIGSNAGRFTPDEGPAIEVTPGRTGCLIS